MTTDDNQKLPPHRRGEVTSVDGPSEKRSTWLSRTNKKAVSIIAASIIGLSAVGGGAWYMVSNSGDNANHVVEKRDVNKGMGQQHLPEAKTIAGVGKGKFSAVDPLTGKRVDADIVGIDTTGDPNNAVLAPPEDISQAGWYVRSAPFGVDKGSTVMTSHIDYNGVTGLGTLFSSLRKDDPVTLTDSKGKQHHYVVTEQIKLNKEDPEYIKKTMDTINKKDGKNILVLITCGGDYNPSSPLGYNQNWITVAHPVKDGDSSVKDVRN